MKLARKARPRKTIEDFLNLPEGSRAELIDGELCMSPSPRQPHQWAVGNLYVCLAQFVHSNKLGKVFISPFDVHLPSGDIVEPDILYVAKKNLGIVGDWVKGTPDLAVEVLSPEGIDRDRFVKRKLYAQNGVGEYWIADPIENSIEVLTLKDDAYEPNGYFEFADTLSSPLFPGLKLLVASIYSDPTGVS